MTVHAGDTWRLREPAMFGGEVLRVFEVTSDDAIVRQVLPDGRLSDRYSSIPCAELAERFVLDRREDLDPEPIHNWFELSYAQYLTIPRSVLQSMPSEWQARFVACLEQLDEAIDWRPCEGRYWVTLKDRRGRYVRDPLADYERGRRRVPVRKDGG